MRIKAEGGGYNAIYTARNTWEGWCFMQQDGTFLTPGIGHPMFYDSPDELLDAVLATCEAKIRVLGK